MALVASVRRKSVVRIVWLKIESGKTEYAHQRVAAVLVHPNQKVVIPIWESLGLQHAMA